MTFKANYFWGKEKSNETSRARICGIVARKKSKKRDCGNRSFWGKKTLPLEWCKTNSEIRTKWISQYVPKEENESLWFQWYSFPFEVSSCTRWSCVVPPIYSYDWISFFVHVSTIKKMFYIHPSVRAEVTQMFWKSVLSGKTTNIFFEFINNKKGTGLEIIRLQIFQKLGVFIEMTKHLWITTLVFRWTWRQFFQNTT